MNKISPKVREILLFIAKELEGKGQPEGDKAGETLYGITKKYYPIEYELLENVLGADADELVLDRTILDIYSKIYISFRATELPYPLNVFYFDHCFNAGQKAGVKLLQRTLNHFKLRAGADDGIWGRMTQGAVNKLNQNFIFQTNPKLYLRNMADFYLSERIKYYTSLSQREFLVGWVMRVVRLANFVYFGILE